MTQSNRRIPAFVACLVLSATVYGCRSTAETPPAPMPPTVPVGTAWSPTFDPPSSLDTGRAHLEPLGPEHAVLDYAAFMSSRRHLQRTLHWGNWPSDDMTVEQNEKDLARHAKEFADREGYAYTVLSPDQTRCVGCIYINPVEGNPFGASLAYWVTETEVMDDLDIDLLTTLFAWFRVAWPFDWVGMDLHVENQRGIEIVMDLGLVPVKGGPENHQRMVWRR